MLISSFIMKGHNTSSAIHERTVSFVFITIFFSFSFAPLFLAGDLSRNIITEDGERIFLRATASEYSYASQSENPTRNERSIFLAGQNPPM